MIYTTSYWHGGKTISIEIYGDEQEVFNHCKNLGFDEPDFMFKLNLSDQ